MKKIPAILLILICLLTGCTVNSVDILLHQPDENIQLIELVDHSAGERVVLKTILAPEMDSFLEKMRKLECYQYHNDPPSENGYLSIFVYYDNGLIDVIGTDICYSEPSEEDVVGWFYVDANAMRTLFSQYIDSSYLPEYK